MASSNQPNWNIVIIGGALVAGLYIYNKIQSGTPARDYVLGSTGQTASEVTQPTIRTDIRQASRTNRILGRQQERTSRVLGRQEEKTERVIGRQEQKTERTTLRTNVRVNRQDERTSRVQIRQTARTTRQAQRQQTILKIGSGIKQSISTAINRLKRKK